MSYETGTENYIPSTENKNSTLEYKDMPFSKDFQLVCFVFIS